MGKSAGYSPFPDTTVERGETILLVDDEGMVRTVYGEILKRGGYRVLSAENGTEALRILEECGEPVHLLVTDVMMPGMNGAQLAERVRDLRPDTGVIFMSGSPQEEVIRSLQEEKAAPFLAKPVPLRELLRTVRRLLDTNSRVRQARA